MREDTKGLIELVDLGLLDRVEELLRMGYGPNVKGDYDQTPAVAAAKNDSIRMLKVLVEYGADLNEPDSLGFTPLFWAEKNNNEEMARFIIANLDSKRAS